VLDAEQHHVCVWQDNVPVVVLGTLSSGVQAGGEPKCMGLLEDCCCELRLQECLAAAACHTATSIAQVGGHTACMNTSTLAVSAKARNGSVRR
jgi:hypothetical protein